MFPLDDTIVAVASPPGGAAQGILRVSGPNAHTLLAQCFFPDDALPLSSRHMPCAIEGGIRLSGLHLPLPATAYLWAFGRSYTGETAAEVHTLGSPPLLQLLLRNFLASGARLAERGEFTFRALLKGKLDLSQAEAVLAVIEATDRRQLHSALAQLAGGLARTLHRLRDMLIDLLADVEAGLDFPEEDIPFFSSNDLRLRLGEALKKVTSLEKQMEQRTTADQAATVVIIGRPNAGKSSLFNALLGRKAALVSTSPGTTRDFLTAELDLDGGKCRLIDTAGIGFNEFDVGVADPALAAAVRAAAIEQRNTADLLLLCIDSTQPLAEQENNLPTSIEGCRVQKVLTKCDLQRHPTCPRGFLETSSVTGEGIAALRRLLCERLSAGKGSGATVLAETAARCRQALPSLKKALRRALRCISQDRRELLASEIRTAVGHLDALTGAACDEEVLTRLFNRFCIGK